MRNYIYDDFIAPESALWDYFKAHKDEKKFINFS